LGFGDVLKLPDFSKDIEQFRTELSELRANTDSQLEHLAAIRALLEEVVTNTAK
jgi:hypothetical protein